jgi:hypothetical protein
MKLERPHKKVSSSLFFTNPTLSTTPFFLGIASLVIVFLLSSVTGVETKISQNEVSLSSINLLLPITEGRDVSYTLEGFNGCFLW